jgi:hypothetical protein
MSNSSQKLKISVFSLTDHIKRNGLYGDIRILDITDGNKINDYLDNNIEMVFRASGSVSYNDTTKYCEFFNITGFNALIKTNDNYGDIIYRIDKLKRIKNNIINYEN